MKSAIEELPIGSKYALTVEEASAYFNIGIRAIYNIVNTLGNPGFVLRRGRRILIKREMFEAYLNDSINI